MCFGSKKSSTAAPAPSPPTTFTRADAPADYTNTQQRSAAVASSTNSQMPTTQGDATYGSELAK